VRQAESIPRDSETDRQSRRHVPTLLLLEVDQLTDESQRELEGFLALPGFELYSIATSEESLIALAERGRFRPDLAHALSTLTIHMPPLCQRLEDIPLLSQHFVEKFNAQGDRQLSGFSSEALDELAGYAWPDNIDELADLVELACHGAEGPVIEVGELPAQIQWAVTADAHPRQQDEPIDLDEFLAEIEKELMQRALRRCKGNKTRAARLLGINRARLLRRLDHFGIA
jgi:DNA-binding NtrC family response regulator